MCILYIVNSSGGQMGIKGKKKVTSKSEKRSVQRVEDWAENIAKRKPRRSVIEDILPAKKGEYIAIAGRTGIGKTNLSLHLAFCLATKTPFFGLECRKYKVAFIAFEGDETNVKDRYDKLKNSFPPTEGNLFFGMMPVSNPKNMFKEIFDETEDCSILILDPVKYLVLGDYLKPQDAATFVRQFRENLALHKKAAIITLPIRKPNVKSLIQPGDVYQMKGATEYADSATSVLLLEKKSYSRSSSNKVTLHFAKHRIAARELKPINLRFSRKKCRFIAQEE
jgi:RecA-family ATPase